MANLEVVDRWGRVHRFADIEPAIGDAIRDLIAGRIHTVDLRSPHGGPIPSGDITEITIRF